MKKVLFILTLFILTASSVYSAPNYDPNHKCITYDVSYNVALRNKLEADFDKKYIVKKTAEGIEHSYPTDAYYQEVLKPYCLQKKPDNYKIIKD